MHKVDVPTHGWAFPVSVHLTQWVCVYMFVCLELIVYPRLIWVGLFPPGGKLSGG